MNRRDVLKVSAGVVALPALTPAQQTKDQVPNGPGSAAWKPSVSSEAQNATVVALTEAIIPATDTPGAKEAKVNQYIDLLLRDGPAEERERFLSGLAWLDRYAQTKGGKPFAQLPASAQIAVLEEIDQEGKPAVAEGYRFFRMAKAMTARLYYQTAVGFRELNKGGRVPSSVGCQHPAKHSA